MKVNRIKVINFRNYGEEELFFDDRKNIFLGENAQGKTNILEAIYICSFARSFRTQNAVDMIKLGEESASVTLDAESQGTDKKISIIINDNGKKMIKKDNKPVRRTAELLNNLVVVIFSPEDLKIIKDSPEKRRNFLNKEISQIKPNYYENLRRYNEVLKQKNAVLKGPDPLRDETMLDVFDRQLCKYGTEVMKYRERFVKMLSDKSSEIQNKISCGKESLEIEYKNSAGIETFGEELSKNRKNDIYSRSSGIGPQRDDLVFFINGKDARKYGSQGQQRTIALSLKLAEIQIVRKLIDEDPILLLDDVLSELDAERQKFLLNEIENVQLFVTATEINGELLKKTDKGKIFTVNNGNVTEENR